MADEGFKRKLTAILSADVEGYSRLMADDEVGTILTLKDYRKIMSACIEQHGGSIVDAVGDNLLAKFGSAVDAVECAVEVQKELKYKNQELPEDKRLEFRIGVNIGDVIQDGDRLFGDGVNIAARIQGLAEAGGVCISRNTYDHIRNKFSLSCEYLGEHSVKNIKQPVRAYKVQLDSDASKPLVSEPLELPDKPSIAVLPFVNMSGDPSQEYFSDGLTEDIITDLSQISGMLVIARQSVYTYKGKAVKVQEVSKDLKVRYVLEGSVRKAGDIVRITAQLIDGETGGHLWAERYDRKLKDIFEVQDEVTHNVVKALAIKLTKVEKDRLNQRYTDNLEAYDYALRGLENYYQYTKDANVQALKMFEKAIELDPKYALAYSWLGLANLHSWTQGWNSDPEVIDLAFDLAQKALNLDNGLSEPHRIMGDIYLYKKQHEKAFAERRRSIALDPNNTDALAGLGEVYIYDGQLEDGIALIEKAIRLNPHHHAWYFWVLSSAYIIQGQYQEAETLLKRTLIRSPNFVMAHLSLACIYVETERFDKAHLEIEELLNKNQGFSIEFIKEISPFKDKEINDRIIKGLRKAGLPE